MIEQSPQVRDRIEKEYGERLFVRHAVRIIVDHLEKEDNIKKVIANSFSLNENKYAQRVMRNRAIRIRDIDQMLDTIEKRFGKKVRDFTLNKGYANYSATGRLNYHPGYTDTQILTQSSLATH